VTPTAGRRGAPAESPPLPVDDEGVPAGWTLGLDPTARRTDAGTALIGGTPLRVLRLSAAGARLLDRLAGGEPLPAGSGARRLARRLADAGLAAPHPAPGAPATFTAADVAVVVPVRDDPDGVARTLAAVGDVGEVVVVDDGSADPAAVRRAAPGATVVHHPRSLGPGGARETGWRATHRPVVAFLDTHVEVQPGWLDGLLAHLDDPAVAAVAPRVRSAPGEAPPWLARYEWARSPLDRGPVPAPVRPGSRVTYVPTAALVIRRDALAAVGGLDAGLRVGEDVDLVWRLHAAGLRVRYEPAVLARHPSRSTLAAWLRQRHNYGRSAAPLADRHGDAVAPLGISGWSALAWGLVLLGRPLAGTAVGAATTAALTPRLRGLAHPAAEAVRIAGTGNLYAGRAVADALSRPWWPLALLLGAVHRRSRPALLAAAVVPPLLEWREDRPPVAPATYAALRLLDDLAYGAGVWTGCVERRSYRALLPRFTGRFPRPAAAT